MNDVHYCEITPAGVCAGCGFDYIANWGREPANPKMIPITQRMIDDAPLIRDIIDRGIRRLLRP